jgi:predicted enzyme related to lactoylglutathione lyase
MAKVLGVGGLFFKAGDSGALMDWYQRVLGLEVLPWGGVVFPAAKTAEWPGAATVFNHFAPSQHEFMFNLMVDELDAMLARCAEHGVVPVKLIPGEAMGGFARILDPEGRKIELWQPKPMTT